MDIIKNQIYKIKGNSKYFKNKYGTSNPEIKIEGTDKEALGHSWMIADGNPAAMLFAMRSGLEGLAFDSQTQVYYGKIDGLGELVYESELEKISVEPKER